MIPHALHTLRSNLIKLSECLCGIAGQAIVQMARDRLNGLEYAIKLFLSRRTFNVRPLYFTAKNPQMVPQAWIRELLTCGLPYQLAAL
jgi:hypothetical protein